MEDVEPLEGDLALARRPLGLPLRRFTVAHLAFFEVISLYRKDLRSTRLL